jgi:hypothetical protein
MYYHWATRIRCTAFFNTAFMRPILGDRDLQAEAKMAALIWCFAFAVSMKEEIDWAESLLIELAQSSESIPTEFWSRRRLEPFVVRLICTKNRVPVPETITVQPPFRELLSNWNDKNRFGASIAEVCDYHCEKIADTDISWDSEFKSSPFDLLPCEIWAILQFRQMESLITPKVNHPLLIQPTGEPITASPFSDPLIEKIKLKYCDLFDQRL